VKLASKQLLALGIKPSEVVELDHRAEGEGIALRELVQAILRDWLKARQA